MEHVSDLSQKLDFSSEAYCNKIFQNILTSEQ